MLLTTVDVISCENPRCREFASIVPSTLGVKSYYCPVCSKISYPRLVDATLADSPAHYEAHLRAVLAAETHAVS